MPRWFIGVGLGVAASLGCASQTQVTGVSPGIYQLECRSSLANCLLAVEALCRAHGYDVLVATERREYVKDSPEAREWVKASARVRCREAVPLFGPDPNAPLPPASAASPAASVPAAAASAPPSVPAVTAVAPAPSAPPAAPSSPSPAAPSSPPPPPLPAPGTP
jgi:hypothetical protein